VAVRFIAHDDIYAVSGVYLIEEENNQIIDQFVLTIGYFPKANYKILITSNRQPFPETVNWYPGGVQQTYHLNEHPSLMEKIHFFNNSHFKFLPHDTISHNNHNNLCLFKLKVHDLSFIAANKFLSIDFNSENVEIGDAITINSFPFNFTNSLLFSNFISKGTINYKLDNVSFLSDVKYLENTIGAIVNYDLGSVGLIMGHFSKLNGDGDLTIILSWDTIWHFLSGKTMKYVLSSGGISAEQAVVPSTNPSQLVSSEFPVYAILLSNSTTKKWGSCIYYKPGVFVTNNHVINDLKQFKGEIFLSNSVTIPIRMVNIYTPFSELDLAFIYIDNTHDLSHLTPVNTTTNYDIGDPVSSIGYGLFFNENWLKPVESKGTINCRFELPLQDSGRPTNSIIITSSSCWNGSSGGGLFNNKNELIGLICCNAQVKVPSFDDKGEFVTNTEKVEKLSEFSLVLPIEVIDYCFTRPESINPDVTSIWQLNSFHNDVIVESSKL